MGSKDCDNKLKNDMRILIIEDEPPVADYLEKCTRSLLQNKIKELKIMHSLEDAKEYLKKNKIDLCILDLNLHGENGFEVLKSSVSKPFQTIVVSAYTEKAIEAFEYGVIDFVPKSLKLDRLRTAFDRYFGREDRPQATKYLITRKNNKNFLLPVERIIYLKADRYLVEAYCKDSKKEIIDKSLNLLEIVLPKHFMRIHRSFIVNLENIEYFEHSGSNIHQLKLVDGTILPISRQRYNALKQYFSDPASS